MKFFPLILIFILGPTKGQLFFPDLETEESLFRAQKLLDKDSVPKIFELCRRLNISVDKLNIKELSCDVDEERSIRITLFPNASGKTIARQLSVKILNDKVCEISLDESGIKFIRVEKMLMVLSELDEVFKNPHPIKTSEWALQTETDQFPPIVIESLERKTMQYTWAIRSKKSVPLYNYLKSAGIYVKIEKIYKEEQGIQRGE